MRAPCTLMAWTRSARPNAPSLTRFAPNVFVSTTSAPARTYAWWTSATRSGCVRFSSSNERLRKIPFAYSIVPIAELVAEAVMVAEKVESRLHHGEQLVDRRLAGVRAAVARIGTERLRRLVRQQHVDVAQGFARIDFLANEMPPFVGELGRFRA